MFPQSMGPHHSAVLVCMTDTQLKRLIIIHLFSSFLEKIGISLFFGNDTALLPFPLQLIQVFICWVFFLTERQHMAFGIYFALLGQ